jgi:hypothetical protein
VPTNRSQSDPRSPVGEGAGVFNRSSITNGTNLLPGVHKGSQWARRFRDIISAYSSDQGGEAHLSEGRRSIFRRIACLQVELELLEVRFALAGGAEPADLDLYQRATGSLRRLLEAVGLDRTPRDVTPDLDAYVAANYGEPEPCA